MRILIITQKVDRNDTILGFFHGWLIEFSKKFSEISVICLEKGKFELSSNVRVFSLGKEENKSRSIYLFRFYKYIWQYRKDYDVVFVHMNQEYLLLAGWWWRIIGKKVGMWRNHHSGSILTDIASFFCNVVFCTSKFSYTAKYKKTVLMPVGVDTNLFKIRTDIKRVPNSILFLGRISPVKRVHIFIDALWHLKNAGLMFTSSIYGDALPKDFVYLESLKKQVKDLGLDHLVSFYSGVPNYQTVEIYNRHEIYINLSSSGMYDKTIFEAMACGCKVLSTNKNLKEGPAKVCFIDVLDAPSVSRKFLQYIDKDKNDDKLVDFVYNNNLAELAKRLYIVYDDCKK